MPRCACARRDNRPTDRRTVNTQSSVGVLPREPLGQLVAGVNPTVRGQVTVFSLDRVRQSKPDHEALTGLCGFAQERGPLRPAL